MALGIHVLGEKKISGVLWAELKISKLYSISGQNKIPKLPEMLSSILKKISLKSFKASGFFKFPKSLSRNDFFSVYVICPKFPNC
jgi:hypothetical protein